MADRISWREFAACKGQTDLFFYHDHENTKQREKREEQAKLLCESCPVREPCKQDGRVNNEIGIWGGENEEGRYKAGYIQTGSYTRRRQFRKKYGKIAPKSDIEKV